MKLLAGSSTTQNSHIVRWQHVCPDSPLTASRRLLSEPHSWVFVPLPPWCLQPASWPPALHIPRAPSILSPAPVVRLPITCLLGPRGYPRLHGRADGLSQAPPHNETHRLCLSPRSKPESHPFCFSPSPSLPSPSVSVSSPSQVSLSQPLPPST